MGSPRITSSRLLLGFSLSILLLLIACAVSELPRNQALHITMRDGVRIAIDVWLPEGLDPDAKIPTIMRSTRYWRAVDVVGGSLEQDRNYREAERFNQQGYGSELRVDAMPLVPGEIAELSFDLWATSVLIKKGHRIRIALAGADKDSFARYPRGGGTPTITVSRNSLHPSHIVLPMMKK